jgi:hypothetical protein
MQDTIQLEEQLKNNIMNKAILQEQGYPSRTNGQHTDTSDTIGYPDYRHSVNSPMDCRKST